MVALSYYSVINILIILTATAIAFYKYFTRNFDYWKKRNVPCLTPLPIFGNFFEVFILRKSIAVLLWNLYDRYNSPYFGIYVLNEPHVVIKDLDLIKSVLVKDFHNFYDRAVTSDEECDSLSSKMLFLSKNPEWRYVRTKIAPVFSTGKIKSMVALINDVGDKMVVYLDKLVPGSVEIRELALMYATDVITSCAFGLNANSFHTNDGKFRIVGKMMFDTDWKTSARHASYFIAPSLVKFFKMPFFHPSTTSFLRDIFWRTIDDRETSHKYRNDLIDIIINMRKQHCPDDNVKFEGDLVVAQAAQFFAAGFETVGSTISFALYELSLAPDIQNKLHLEIKNAIVEHGSLTYDVIQNLKYLDMVVSETLRKYPALPFLDRRCAEDYKVPNSDLILKKDSFVFISVFGLHYDTNYFPNPEKFSPDRFSDENRNTIPNFCYLPFGDGPRNCIGGRFGLVVTKLGIAHIISKFKLEPSIDTPIPIKFMPKGFILKPTTKLNLKFHKI